MPKKAYIFAFTNKPQKIAKIYSIRRFEEELTKKGLHTQVLSYYSTTVEYKKNNLILKHEGKLINLNDSVVVLRNICKTKSGVRDAGKFQIIVKFLKRNNIPTLNIECFDSYELFDDKLYQYNALSNLEIPLIPTEFFDQKEMMREKQLPYLLKPRLGSGGKGIQMVHTKEDLDEIENIAEYIIQPFIENDYDLRIITTQDKIIASMKRSRTEGIVNNYSSGGSVEAVEIDSQKAELAKKICKIMKADYLAVDIIVEKGTNRFFILEVNRHAQVSGIETSTGQNVVAELIDMLPIDE